MARPLKPRRICFCPDVYYFKPRGVPLVALEEVNLLPEELEALKYCDSENIEQTKAAKKMKISQSTLSRILLSARKKVASAIIEGKAIRLEKL
ncbi:DUF134 domain-containing protein [Candidatus Parcubacteria bacterium]|nr:DUF134 domain-containing protein [Candidatus Parcubacteria bacterium]